MPLPSNCYYFWISVLYFNAAGWCPNLDSSTIHWEQYRKNVAHSRENKQQSTHNRLDAATSFPQLFLAEHIVISAVATDQWPHPFSPSNWTETTPFILSGWTIAHLKELGHLKWIFNKEDHGSESVMHETYALLYLMPLYKRKLEFPLPPWKKNCLLFCWKAGIWYYRWDDWLVEPN